MSVLLKSTFARFTLVGLVNSLLGLFIIFSAKLLGFSDVSSNAGGYLVGILVSFTLNRHWTFPAGGALASAPPEGLRGTGVIQSFPRFLLVIAAAYCANLATVLSLIDGLGVNGYLAQAGGVPVYALGVYAGCRYFVFPQTGGGK